MNQVGSMLEEQGRIEEAEILFHRALTGRERVSGIDHPSTLIIVGNLGSIYQDQGQLEKAELFFQRAYEGCERVLGLDDPETLTAMCNLGLLLKKKKKI